MAGGGRCRQNGAARGLRRNLAESDATAEKKVWIMMEGVGVCVCMIGVVEGRRPSRHPQRMWQPSVDPLTQIMNQTWLLQSEEAVSPSLQNKARPH